MAPSKHKIRRGVAGAGVAILSRPAAGDPHKNPSPASIGSPYQLPILYEPLPHFVFGWKGKEGGQAPVRTYRCKYDRLKHSFLHLQQHNSWMKLYILYHR